MFYTYTLYDNVQNVPEVEIELIFYEIWQPDGKVCKSIIVRQPAATNTLVIHSTVSLNNQHTLYSQRFQLLMEIEKIFDKNYPSQPLGPQPSYPLSLASNPLSSAYKKPAKPRYTDMYNIPCPEVYTAEGKTIKCNNSFFNTSDRESHRAHVHKPGFKPFICDKPGKNNELCHYMFGQQGALTLHQKREH